LKILFSKVENQVERTVEKYSGMKRKERNHKGAAHHSILLIGRNWVLKILLRPNVKKGITKSSTSLNPCFHR
jgi:hypothetical protein